MVQGSPVSVASSMSTLLWCSSCNGNLCSEEWCKNGHLCSSSAAMHCNSSGWSLLVCWSSQCLWMLKLIQIWRIGLSLVWQPAVMRHLAETTWNCCSLIARPLHTAYLTCILCSWDWFLQLSWHYDDDGHELMGTTAGAHFVMLALCQLRWGR